MYAAHNHEHVPIVGTNVLHFLILMHFTRRHLFIIRWIPVGPLQDLVIETSRLKKNYIVKHARKGAIYALYIGIRIHIFISCVLGPPSAYLTHCVLLLCLPASLHKLHLCTLIVINNIYNKGCDRTYTDTCFVTIVIKSYIVKNKEYYFNRMLIGCMHRKHSLLVYDNDLF